ncbi:hypothetical protein ACFQV2_04310 [Actinokineospora soli]|uniref:Secreted protein n=1 Tax=Actinokineospora soli TaxID=1048753 RepID=A0ABW2TJ26_9PSEU
MAVGTRFAGIASLTGAVLAAVTLTGVAVLTVQAATCEDTGHYVQVDGRTTLVGGCLDPEDLPAAPPTTAPEPGDGAGSGIDRLRQSP